MKNVLTFLKILFVLMVSPPLPSRRTLKSFVKEERQTSKLYAKLGFRKQAMQEKQHARFFKSVLRIGKKP